jgi:hypothetical protein
MCYYEKTSSILAMIGRYQKSFSVVQYGRHQLQIEKGEEYAV